MFADQAGPFGSTTSDSERAMVRLETTRLLMVVISFLGSKALDGAVAAGGRLAGAVCGGRGDCDGGRAVKFGGPITVYPRK